MEARLIEARHMGVYETREHETFFGVRDDTLRNPIELGSTQRWRLYHVYAEFDVTCEHCNQSYKDKVDMGCLAPSEHDALSQVLPSGTCPEQCFNVKVTQMPFKIRGWGHNEF